MSDVVGSGTFRYRVDPSWARLMDGWDHGEAPAVACDARDRVFVFLRGPRPVMTFEADGAPLGSWGEGSFVRPHGMFIAGDAVYCTDDLDHTVRRYSLDGKLQLTMGTSGKASDTGATSIDYRTVERSAGPFHYPTNLAIGPDGDLWISDGYGNARVHRFATDGKLKSSWGEPGTGPGQFLVPHGIAVDGQGTIYVADRENSRVQLFAPDGKLLDIWSDVARPCQVFIDRDGFVFVAELGFRAGRWPGTGSHRPKETGGRVSIFDRTGALQSRWGGGENPCAPGDFFAPHDICVDSAGSVYVAEVTLSAGGRAGKVPLTCHTLQKFVRV